MLLVHALHYFVGFVLRLFMCLLVHHDSRWRHVSFWRDVHRVHFGGDRSCVFFNSSLSIYHI